MTRAFDARLSSDVRYVTLNWNASKESRGLFCRNTQNLVAHEKYNRVGYVNDPALSLRITSHRISKNAATSITAQAALVPNTRKNIKSISSIISSYQIAKTITAKAANATAAKISSAATGASSDILKFRSRVSMRKRCAAAIVDSYNNFVSVH